MDFLSRRLIIFLKNKNYIGVFEYQGKKEKNDIVIEIEPIVSRYMWNKVNLKKIGALKMALYKYVVWVSMLIFNIYRD